MAAVGLLPWSSKISIKIMVSIREAGESDGNIIATLSRQTFTEAFSAVNTPENMALFMAGPFSVATLEAETKMPGLWFFIAWNEGEGKFTPALLPYQVQLSTVNAATVADINGDGLPDLVTAGNLASFQPQFGSIDAGFGHILINQGKRAFSVLSDQGSGLMVTGITKDIARMQYRGSFSLIFARNNNQVLLYNMQPVQHKHSKK